MFKKWFGFGKKEEEKPEDEAIGINEGGDETTPVEETASQSDVDTEAAAAVEAKAEVETEAEVMVEVEVAPDEAEAEVEIIVEAESEVETDDEAEELIIEKEIEHAWEVLAEQESEPESDVEAPAEETKKKSWFDKLKEGLTKTSKAITDKIDDLFSNYGQIDDELYEELEEILIMADIGMETTMKIVADLKQELRVRKISDAAMVKPVLRDVIERLLDEKNDPVLHITPGPALIFVIGVNGAGKTTTIGKIAHNLKKEGKTVILAAADTFRAAAIDQLKVWGERAGVPVISQQEGADPAAVVYDGIQAAKSRKTDVLIIDTAGRLHNKVNLMNELSKIFRVIEREYPEAKKEILLVLDATTGQNGIQQAKLFKEAADLTGIVLTKLDGTAKGGVVLAINYELGIPVKLVGVGEGINDLQSFSSKEFADALLER